MEVWATSAAIIAGGQARRFAGLDKSRLVVEGRSIIVRQLDVLQQVASSIVAIGGPEDRFADLNVPVVADRIAALGAIGGIYTAVASTSAQRVLVVACDLPFLHVDLLRRLVELSTGRDGAWVATSRGIEPLLACYDARSAPKIRHEIDAGRLKASALGMALDMAELGERQIEQYGAIDRLLANVNTPDDFARVQYPPA